MSVCSWSTDLLHALLLASDGRRVIGLLGRCQWPWLCRYEPWTCAGSGMSEDNQSLKLSWFAAAFIASSRSSATGRSQPRPLAVSERMGGQKNPTRTELHGGATLAETSSCRSWATDICRILYCFSHVKYN